MNILKDLENIQDKSAISIPGRPIISQCNSPLEHTGMLIDYFLLSFVKRQNTYLRDTTHLINIIEKTKCPSEIILSSYDIPSVYTN